MLDVEPPAGLRGRVLDRIDALSTNSVASAPGSVASAFRRNFGSIAVPVAAAAVIALAVLAPWRHTAPPVVTTTPPAVARVDPPPSIAPPVSPRLPERRGTASMKPPRATPPGQRPSPRSIQEGIVVATVVTVDVESNQMDPLAPIAPITVAGANPRDITPKQIAISPLTPIAELQIAPLSPPERRN